MRFAAAMMDVAGTDPRVTGGGRTPTDRSAADQAASGFGGVLAETEARDAEPGAGADTTLADTSVAQNGAMPASAGGIPQPGRSMWPPDRSQPDLSTMTSSLDMPRPGSVAPSQAASRAGPTATSWSVAFSAGMASMPDANPPGRVDDASMEAPRDLAAGSESKVGVPTLAGASLPTETGDLLAVPSKDDKSADRDFGGGKSVVSAPSDLMSMLLLSAGVTPPAIAPTTIAPGPSEVASVSAEILPRSIDPRAAGQTDEPSSDAETMNGESADAKATGFTGFALETHLAPVAQASGRDASSGQAPNPRGAREVVGSSQPLDTNAGTGSSPVAARSDDLVPVRRSADPSAPVGTTAGLVPGAPVRSVAAAIVDMAVRSSPASAEPAVATSPAPIARTLTLQLSPADLGTVDIRLHMSGRALDVELSISDANTLGLVSRERDALASALHDSNYALQSLVIQDGGRTVPPGGHHDSSRSTSGGDPRPDQSGSEAGAGQRGGGGRSQGEPPRPGSERRAAASAAPGDRRGSLFV